MTDTAYLYQYFLENSAVKKDAVPKAANKANQKPDQKEGKRDGKPAKQHV